MILCDTNIFIHAFKGDAQTIAELTKIGLDNIAISSITIMELYQGMTNKRELNTMKARIEYYDVVNFDLPTSVFAVELIEKFNLSHNLQIPDAIIGASAVIHNIELFTYNLRDFRFIPNIRLRKF